MCQCKNVAMYSQEQENLTLLRVTSLYMTVQKYHFSTMKRLFMNVKLYGLPYVLQHLPTLARTIPMQTMGKVYKTKKNNKVFLLWQPPPSPARYISATEELRLLLLFLLYTLKKDRPNIDEA